MALCQAGTHHALVPVVADQTTGTAPDSRANGPGQRETIEPAVARTVEVDSRAHSQPRVARLHRIGPFAARQTQRAPSSEPARLSAASSTPGPLLAQDRCLACIPRSRIGRRVSPRC